MRIWIFSKTEDPQIIEEDDIDDYPDWARSPAAFFSFDAHGLDPDDDMLVQVAGNALCTGVEWMNLELNIDKTRKKDLIEYAKEVHDVKIPKRYRVNLVRERVHELLQETVH